MAVRTFVSRALTLSKDTNGKWKAVGKPGETVQKLWIQFVSKETPRMKNWDQQQLAALDSARSEHMI